MERVSYKRFDNALLPDVTTIDTTPTTDTATYVTWVYSNTDNTTLQQSSQLALSSLNGVKSVDVVTDEITGYHYRLLKTVTTQRHCGDQINALLANTLQLPLHSFMTMANNPLDDIDIETLNLYVWRIKEHQAKSVH